MLKKNNNVINLKLINNIEYYGIHFNNWMRNDVIYG